MSNILWIQPNQTLALTSIIVESVNSQSHAKELQDRGDIPADWIIAAYDIDWVDNTYPQEAYRWNGTNIVLDETALAEIQAENAEPTKAELLAQLQALTTKIEALV